MYQKAEKGASLSGSSGSDIVSPELTQATPTMGPRSVPAHAVGTERVIGLAPHVVAEERHQLGHVLVGNPHHGGDARLILALIGTDAVQREGRGRRNRRNHRHQPSQSSHTPALSDPRRGGQAPAPRLYAGRARKIPMIREYRSRSSFDPGTEGGLRAIFRLREGPLPGSQRLDYLVVGSLPTSHAYSTTGATSLPQRKK